MASAVSITKPTVLVNGETIYIIPNSLIVKYGIGEKKTRPQSAGGNQVQLVVHEDITQYVSSIKFKVENTTDNINFFQSINQSLDLKVQFTDPDSGQNGTQNSSVLINDPDFNFGFDGETELEFNGAPIV
jgi:hypothetical protein